MVIESGARLRPGALRWLAGFLVAAAPLAVIHGTYAWWHDRLPDPLPTHWGAGGQVDGTTSRAGFLLVVSIVAGLGALVAAVGAGAGRMRWRSRRALVALGAGVSAFIGGLWLVIVVLSLDHTDPYQVPSPTWHILAFLLGAAGWVALAFAACGRAPGYPAATGRPAEHLPRVDLGPGQRAVWSEVSYPGRWSYLLIAGIVVVAAVLAIWAQPWAASPLVLSAAVAYMALINRLVVDARGLHVGFGPWGWPRITVPMREIVSAEVTTARPAEWGGWGYRIRLDGARGLILRHGPAVRLRLSEGRQFVASVRDPETAAALINTLVDRHRR